MRLNLILFWLSAVNLLRCFRGEPDIGDVAVCHLLARAVERSGVGWDRVSDLSRRKPALIILHSDIDGFDRILLRMLSERRLPRGHVVVQTLDQWGSTTTRLLKRTKGAFPQAGHVITTFDADTLEQLALTGEDCIGDALLRGEWPLGIVGPRDEIPPDLNAAADLVLDTGLLDGALVNTLLDAVTAHDADTVLPDGFTLTSLRGLRLSFRDGGTRREILGRLAAQGELEGKSQTRPARKAEKDGDGKTETDARKPAASGERGRHGKKIVSDSRLIEPEPLDDCVDKSGNATSTGPQGSVRDMPILRVETLFGYGEAVDWALGLKEDLALWRSGSFPWQAMSTRLLLSGPPGTGKTIFARALCNSLRIPLLATSVATWLRMSHLGDVLLRMKSAFEEAAAHAPAILFIDEIDSIGQRQDQSREHSDYWNAVVNQFLELMDGAVKQQGIVILGATNRPDDIDEAVVRSGRLETHVRIPRPDTDALTGILSHHLGADLDTVLATRRTEEGR